MVIGSKEWSDLIIEGATAFDIALNHTHTRQFALHASELVQWNQKFNITAITDPLEIAVKHFLDSLAVARRIPSNAKLLDIGSGGGFPGLALKVCLPGLTVTLIDASRKKVNFLKQVIRVLKLDHIEALHIRAEALAQEAGYFQRYDIVISRAVSSLETFCQLAWPLLADNGFMLALKGAIGSDELQRLQAADLAGGDKRKSVAQPLAVSAERYRLPILNSRRSVVVIRKTRHTPWSETAP